MPAARRLPWVVHWHADIPLDSASTTLRLAYPFYRPWEHALLARADAVIATSAAYRDASTALRPFLDKVEVIPLALEPADPPPPGAGLWPTGGRRLLAVGRLSHYKGFEVLLDALATLPGFTLLLIGAGERESALRARLRALGLEARVRMAGQVDQATLEQAYAQAEIFCLPSLDRAEAFGMVLLEAMRAGLPCVASAIPGSGVGEVVADGHSGLLVPPNDATALAAALQRLDQDAALRAALGRNGQARWRDNYQPAPVNAQVEALYRRLLRATAAPAG